ncbi:MAG: hypothetical protein ACK5HL_00835 [Bacilli bacterium]
MKKITSKLIEKLGKGIALGSTKGLKVSALYEKEMPKHMLNK